MTTTDTANTYTGSSAILVHTDGISADMSVFSGLEKFGGIENAVSWSSGLTASMGWGHCGEIVDECECYNCTKRRNKSTLQYHEFMKSNSLSGSCGDYAYSGSCEREPLTIVIGNEEDHVAVLENSNLSVRFFLDKKLSLTQRVVYKLAGFRYEVNKES